MDSKPERTCRRCGTCCLAGFIALAAPDDLERWHRERRRDILALMERERAVWMGDRLVSSRDGHTLRGCPFLTWEGEHTACGIYETRPRVCRDYRPGSSEICPQFTPAVREEERPGERSSPCKDG
jgi:Fe-S-cluster containining protein